MRDVTRAIPAEYMFDGWYVHRGDAEGVLKLVIEENMIGLGLVEGPTGMWGVLYISDRVLFRNHRVGEWVAHGRYPSNEWGVRLGATPGVPR